MKKIVCILLIFSFSSCRIEAQKEKEQSNVNNTVQKVKRDIDFITDSIINSIQTNPERKLDSFVRSKITFKHLKISNGINDWTYHTEFYENGNLKEKGLYLNGWNFGKGYEYDKTGKVISEIDYSNAKIIKGKKLNFEKTFNEYRTKSDSLLIDVFGKAFFENHIRLNLDRTFWYTPSDSGSYIEQRKSMPDEFMFRYSIVENDTIIVTPIEIKFDKKSNFSIQPKDGIPTKPYIFKVNYEKAKNIAEKNGFGIKRHNNIFSQQEYLSLIYNAKEETYYWTISYIPETFYTDSEEGKITRGSGKSMYINCKNEEVSVEDFSHYAIHD